MAVFDENDLQVLKRRWSEFIRDSRAELVAETGGAFSESDWGALCAEVLRRREGGAGEIVDRFLRLPPSSSEARYYFSRKALLRALSSCGAEELSSARAALSHTGDGSEPSLFVAAFAPSAPGLVRVGIDVEPSDRAVSPAVARRIRGGKEADHGIPPLSAWTIKEAAYKANPNAAGTTLPQYRIQTVREESGSRVGEVTVGEAPDSTLIRFAEFRQAGFTFAFARMDG